MTSDFLVHTVAAARSPAGLPRAVTDRVTDIVGASPGLLDGTSADLRRAALEVAVAGLLAADPGAATHRAVSYSAATDTVRVESTDYPLTPGSKVWVVGAGKASYPVAAALEEILRERLHAGVVAVRDPQARSLPHVRVLCADHPLPSQRSVVAAQAILDTVAEAGPGDLVLTCFTGGSSALASLPVPGVSAEDKRELHELLLSSGLAITEINAVRKQVSAFKGGRVALAALPAVVVNLTVSDVAGSRLDVLTDPTVQDRSTAAEAQSILRDTALWDVVPASVRAHLAAGRPTPRLGHEPQTVMLADGATTVAAMADAAHSLGIRAVVVDSEIEGAAHEVGPALARRLIAELADSRSERVMLLGCGGESVVDVAESSSFSLGGPNQHAALAAADTLGGHRAAALFLDTDGSDGGTDLAGGLVDGGTADRAGELGVDLDERLRARRSTQACLELGSGVRTGHTGTNVNDLFVLVAEGGTS